MYLYLLENNLSKKYYIGITDALSRRLAEHNKNNNGYTGSFDGQWLLIGYKEFETTIARKEELRLKKSKNKKYILWYFTGC